MRTHASRPNAGTESVSVPSSPLTAGHQSVAEHGARAAQFGHQLSAQAPMQCSGGSSQANEELQKALGKKGTLHSGILDHVNAKPHTAKGTGGGQSGAESHQQRNASVLKSATQKYLQETGQSSAVLSSSRLRSDEVGQKKSAAAQEKRSEKQQKQKVGKQQQMLEYLGISQEEFEEDPSGYRKMYAQMTAEHQ